MSDPNVRVLSRLEVESALIPELAVAAIEGVLTRGFDPADEATRSVIGLPSGQFFFMPSGTIGAFGAKVAIVHGNPPRGTPAVAATYLLFDPETLSLTTVMDGASLTALRTRSPWPRSVRRSSAMRVLSTSSSSGPEPRHEATSPRSADVRRRMLAG